MKRTLRKLNIKLNKNTVFLTIFVIGVIIGTIFANLLSEKNINELGILNDFFFEKYLNINVNYSELLKFVLLKRLKIILFLWLLSVTFLGIPFIVGFILYYGFSFGFILALGTLKFGFKGLILNIAYIMPHFIIYVPIVIYLINKGYSICTSLYYKKLAGSNSYRNNFRQLFAEYILVLIICLLIFIIGCLLETFINPIIVKLFIKKFIIL